MGIIAYCFYKKRVSDVGEIKKSTTKLPRFWVLLVNTDADAIGHPSDTCSE
jgi:hypothetical protein